MQMNDVCIGLVDLIENAAARQSKRMEGLICGLKVRKWLIEWAIDFFV